MKKDVIIFGCYEMLNPEGDLKRKICITTGSGVFKISVPHDFDVVLDNGNQLTQLDLGHTVQCNTLERIGNFDIDIIPPAPKPIKKKKSKKVKAKIKVLKELIDRMNLEYPDQHKFLAQHLLEELEN